MTPIDYIHIPTEFFMDKTLCDTQRHILGLAFSFNGSGLKLSNRQLADLFGKNPAYISQLISDLGNRKYITIKNRQSKYRIIYFEKNLKVEGGLHLEKPQSNKNLLLGKTGLLLGKPKLTFRKTSKHN